MKDHKFLKTGLTLMIFLSICIATFSQENFIPGNLIALIDAETNVESYCARLEKETNTKFFPAQRLAQSMNLWLLSFNPNQIDTKTALAKAQRDFSTQLVQLNHTDLEQRNTPDDSLFFKQWSFLNDGVNGGSGMSDISATDAWNLTTGGVTAAGDTIVVAVIDGGFYLDHADLKANLYHNRHEIPDNGIDDDQNGYVDDTLGWDMYSNDNTIPLDNHGTHVSGTIGAIGNNGIGVSGINWNVKILPIAGSSSLESTVVQAYGYVRDMRRRYNQTNGEEGAYIVATNSSFGVNYGAPQDYPIWCAMYDSLGYEGVLSAGATANLNIDVDLLGDIPTACDSDFLISVTNSTSSDVRNNGAAFGLQTIDIAAPGTGIYSLNLFNNYGNSTGTSMATPHVAGAVALMYSAACNNYFDLSNFSNSEFALLIKQKLLSSGDPVMALSGQIATGSRLNLFKAVKSISDSCLTVTGITESSICDSCSGSIILNAINEEANTFLWSNGDTSSAINNLCSGNYSVTVSNSYFDTVMMSFSISELGGPIIMAVISQVTCYGGSDGSIVLPNTADYIWLDNSTNSAKMNLEAGIYYVTATDPITQCNTISSFEVISPDSLSVSYSYQLPATITDSSGLLQVLPNGGVAPYSIAWATGETGFTLTGLISGSYSFTLSDANGCEFAKTFFLGTALGKEELNGILQVELYPNPFSGSIVVNAEDQIHSIKVYNSLGSILFDENLDSSFFELNTVNWNRGIYFVEVKTENTSILKKMIKYD